MADRVTMITPMVLVVEDEDGYAEALTVGLTSEGFRVEVAADGLDAMRRFDSVGPDVVLLDVMLPELSGLEVCRQLRMRSRVPIIMITARDSEIDTVVGLEMGADDYVHKPYRLHELVARMRAVMRRVAEPVIERSLLQVGDLILRPAEHTVTIDGKRIDLTLKEFRLLHLLLTNAGKVLSRAEILTDVWGYDYRDDKNKTLDVHLKRLRRKLGSDPAAPTRIVTVRGVGYKYDRPA